MARELKEHGLEVAGLMLSLEESKPSPQLVRELDEAERVLALRETTKRQMPAMERTPRPFAHD